MRSNSRMPFSRSTLPISSGPTRRISLVFSRPPAWPLFRPSVVSRLIERQTISTDRPVISSAHHAQTLVGSGSRQIRMNESVVSSVQTDDFAGSNSRMRAKFHSRPSGKPIERDAARPVTFPFLSVGTVALLLAFCLLALSLALCSLFSQACRHRTLCAVVQPQARLICSPDAQQIVMHAPPFRAALASDNRHLPFPPDTPGGIGCGGTSDGCREHPVGDGHDPKLYAPFPSPPPPEQRAHGAIDRVRKSAGLKCGEFEVPWYQQWHPRSGRVT